MQLQVPVSGTINFNSQEVWVQGIWKGQGEQERSGVIGPAGKVRGWWPQGSISLLSSASPDAASSWDSRPIFSRDLQGHPSSLISTWIKGWLFVFHHGNVAFRAVCSHSLMDIHHPIKVMGWFYIWLWTLPTSVVSAGLKTGYSYRLANNSSECLKEGKVIDDFWLFSSSLYFTCKVCFSLVLCFQECLPFSSDTLQLRAVFAFFFSTYILI